MNEQFYDLPQEIFYMLTWMAEGDVNGRKRVGASVDVGESWNYFISGRNTLCRLHIKRSI